MMQIPEHLCQTIRSVHGEKGEQWLAGFDKLLQDCEEKWGMTVELPSPFVLSFNFVAPAVLRDGTPAVLKLGVPSREFRTELAALRLYDGRGAVRVLAADEERGALLIERVQPGVMLSSSGLGDDDAVLAAAEVMRRLAVPAPDGGEFPSVADWAAGLARLRERHGGGTGPLPERVVGRAEEVFRRLLGEGGGGLLLLHGDLHHGNILSSGHGGPGWLAIDPKGVVGEAEYGTIPLLLNQLPPKGQREVIRRRVELLCGALGLDHARLLAWGFAHAVLSTAWCDEDGVGDIPAGLERAAWFEELLDELHQGQ
ncbi:aminoglycoside phosphotransferase family protein [Paenibacillus sp. JDR-2]|uniref:aminoglycoside phosphotransferase family protein n=1 Tax=Paenibacillus sp. (strain JDR-2) TaxID=324057 RepID=UPI000166AF07|nr:aminoglycoside phosphotransferase family protein [Paenibacillus sp. JDR-2]ACS99028.1 aminoglycoside/hydroxyurea antibiotic resistance kinase [Paenibacillus sp. JDR-2]